MGLGWPLIARMVRIARAENVVSISDFISARYGKSRGVAVLVTVTAAVGLLPYFALQLKAITISFEALASDAAEGAVGNLPGGTTLIVAAAMAAFAVLFGVRSVNANEPHRGLMLAVATESVVKLAAALVVGGAVAFFAFDTPAGARRGGPRRPRPRTAARLRPARPGLVGDLRAGRARLPLPAAAVPRRGRREHPPRRRAHRRLGLPALPRRHQPLRAAGGDRRPDAVPGRRPVQPDTFMVAIPRELGWPWLAFVAFLGGLSAATGMIIVATLALGTMVSNDVILPILATFRGLRERWEANPGPAAARRPPDRRRRHHGARLPQPTSSSARPSRWRRSA